MTQPAYSPDTKRLLLEYLFEDIDYRKECRYMQELVNISKQDETMQTTLAIFIDDSAINHFSLTGLTHN